MTQYAPLPQLLIDIYANLSTGSIPVYNKLPASEVPEPFIVLGPHIDDDQLTARNGLETLTTDLQVDLFYSTDDRLALEMDISTVKRLIKQATDRVTRVTSQTLVDNSIGRDVYHVIFTITAYI